MPDNFIGAVTQEIRFVEQFPDRLDPALVDAAFTKRLQGLLLFLQYELLPVYRVLEAAPQGAVRQLKKVMEQLCLPGIP